MKTTVTEIVHSSRNLAVDREAGKIANVKILGRVSRNGLEYKDKAMREAVALYENACVYIDHARPGREEREVSRSYRDRFGLLQNVRFADDGLYADFHFNPKHALAEQFAWDAEHDSTAIGFSHMADVKIKRHRGKPTVEQIDKVHSVDLVSQPATTASIFESEHIGEIMKTTIRKIALEAPEAVWGVRFLRQITEQDTAVAELPVEAPAEASNEDRVDAAFREMVLAAFDDENLDTKGKLAKIKEILQAQEKLLGGAEKTEEAPAGGVPAAESVFLKTVSEAFDRFLDRFDKRFDNLATTLTKEQTKPRSTSRYRSSGIGDDQKPITTEEFVARLRS